MAFKQFALDEHTVVTIYKRRANRSLRLTITPTGQIRVTIPVWAPYKAGLDFAKSRQSWIETQRQPRHVLQTGQPIGKAHHLRFVADAVVSKPTSRVRINEVTVTHPAHLSISDPTVQKIAESASVRALRSQAEQLLPTRLRDLAAKHGFQYRSVAVKRLKSRWGSCDQNKNIVFNLFLMQLPWDCIDYVIIHELVHTEVLHHGSDFWAAMERVLPNVRQLRKRMRDYQPVLHGRVDPTVA